MLGLACSALGTGLTMPFLYVYLAQVRGIATITVGLLIAWMGLASFAFVPLGGTLIDRFGPRSVMLVGLVVEAISVGVMGWVQTPLQAFANATFVCIGSAGLHPASVAMLTRLVPQAERERVYGVQFMLMNAGFGVGGMVAAFLVDVADPASFQRLYLIDMLSYLGYIAVLLSLPRGTGLAPRGARDERVGGGWAQVLADRTLLRVVGVFVLVVTFGYAQIETGFAAYATTVGGVPGHYLGWAYAANTAAIVLGQLVTLRFVPGRSRTRLLATAAAIWSVAWVLIAWCGRTTGLVAAAFVIGGIFVFGIGETLWAPVAPALVNGLAPEHLRGRYNSTSSLVWTSSSIVGPALAGLLIGSGHSGVWVAGTIGGTAAAAVLFLRLGRHLTAEQDGRVGASGAPSPAVRGADADPDPPGEGPSAPARHTGSPAPRASTATEG